MSAARILPTQIKAIHAIKTRTRLDEPSYRAMLQGYGVASSKDLTSEAADRLIRRMRDIPGASTPVEQVAKRKTAAGKYAPKLQAMWLALYNLGAVEDRRDSAMHAFLEGQTKIPHTRFLQIEEDATKVIQPLKAWMIREGVVWPAADRDRLVHLMALKRAILRAQWLRCVALGVFSPSRVADNCDGLTEYVSAVVRGGSRRLGALDDPSLEPADMDRASAALGKKLRAANAKSAEARHVA